MVQKCGITVVLHPKTHDNTMKILQIYLHFFNSFSFTFEIILIQKML